MPFVNEKIRNEDKLKTFSIITFEKIKTLAPWVPEFSEPHWWIVDREHDVYLIYLTGGGRDQLPYYVLGINEQFVVFNAEEKGNGNGLQGLEQVFIIHDLRIPKTLESYTEKIKQLIKEALEERAFFNPFADGGTIDSPNTVARWNILSINVEFN